MSRTRRVFGSLAALAAIGTSTATLYSHLRAPLPDHSYNDAVPENYGKRTVTKAEVSSFIEGRRGHGEKSVQEAKELLRLVSGYFVHSSDAEGLISPADNWVMWLLGQWDRRFLLSQDATSLLRKGGGSCEQAAVLYTSLAQQLGYDAHLVWLGGHVVSELTIPDKGYQVADPDLGIYWGLDFDYFGKEFPCSEIEKALTGTGYSPRLVAKLSAIYCSPEGNKRSDFPYQEDTFRVEKYSLLLAWLIPIILGIGAVLLLRRKRTASTN